MKNIALLGTVIFLLLNCKEKKTTSLENIQEYTPPSYDTVAVDSFSSGAVSVDVAEQIRKSSVAYQDSLREAARKAKEKEELAIAKAKEEKLGKDEKLTKETKDKEAKRSNSKEENKKPAESKPQKKEGKLAEKPIDNIFLE